MNNNFSNKLRKLKSSAGFTLIELMVAVAIFGIVMITVFGIFMNANNQQRVILAKQGVTDNARYAMEFMIKEIRMARSITTKNTNNSTIVFVNSSGSTITYSLAGNKIIRNDSTLSTGDQFISSSEINVSNLKFRVNNWDDANAPRVTILMKVQKVASSTSEITMEMQTTVSPRLY